MHKLGFALLGLPLLCKPLKRVHLVKSSALKEVRRSNTSWRTDTLQSCFPVAAETLFTVPSSLLQAVIPMRRKTR